MGALQGIGRQLTAIVMMTAASIFGGAPAPAQSSFSAAAEVGDRVVTGYELSQRIRFLEVTSAQGDLRAQALELLIDERLQLAAAERLGISVSKREVGDAVAEIASRTDRTAAEFLSDLANEGVEAETFLATTRAGVAWRSVVRQQFAAAVSVSEAEIDREIGLGGASGGLEVRFAEIFLPTNTDNNAQITADLAPQIAALTSAEEFSDAARRFSVGATRENGGLVEGWVPVGNLPPQLRQELLAMRIGQVTEPVDFSGAVGLFQLRGRREAPKRSVENSGSVDFIRLEIFPARGSTARQEATRIQGLVDTCLDLYGIAKDLPDDRLNRQTIPIGQLPGPVAAEMRRLDPGETSIALSGNDGQSISMLALCARLPADASDGADAPAANRQAVRSRIFNRKLAAQADAFLQELRGETAIAIK